MALALHIAIGHGDDFVWDGGTDGELDIDLTLTNSDVMPHLDAALEFTKPRFQKSPQKSLEIQPQLFSCLALEAWRPTFNQRLLLVHFVRLQFLPNPGRRENSQHFSVGAKAKGLLLHRLACGAS